MARPEADGATLGVIVLFEAPSVIFYVAWFLLDSIVLAGAVCLPVAWRR